MKAEPISSAQERDRYAAASSATHLVEGEEYREIVAAVSAAVALVLRSSDPQPSHSATRVECLRMATAALGPAATIEEVLVAAAKFLAFIQVEDRA